MKWEVRGSQLKEIVKTSGNRYYYVSDSCIGISKDYFHYIYIVKSFNTLTDTVMLRNLAYFYEGHEMVRTRR